MMEVPYYYINTNKYMHDYSVGVAGLTGKRIGLIMKELKGKADNKLIDALLK